MEPQKTRDILFVAWLSEVKGIQFKDYKYINKTHNIAEFNIELPLDKYKELKLEYMNSETMKTKYALRKLKDTLN